MAGNLASFEEIHWASVFATSLSSCGGVKLETRGVMALQALTRILNLVDVDMSNVR